MRTLLERVLYLVLRQLPFAQFLKVDTHGLRRL